MNFFYPTENLQRKPQPLFLTSSQDGGVGRHTAPPRTTKRRTTTNLKTKNNQNCQKIELHGSPTIKELKKTHSSRPVRGAEAGSWAERTRSKAAAGGPGEAAAGTAAVLHSCADKPGGTGKRNGLHNPGLQYREIKPQTSD